jgi:flagellar FliL protein
MATSAAAAKPAAVEAPAAPAQKKSKLLLIVLAVVVLVGAGGAATWWFMQSADEDEEAEVVEKPSIFLPLEQFTVNLQPEEGQQQFLQVAMTLKVSDQEISENIKAQMPQVRSRMLFLLSSKKPSEIGSVEGKKTLSEQLIQEAEAVLPVVKSKSKKGKKADEDGDESKPKKAKSKKSKAKDEPQAQEESAARRVLAVYFTHFIVQ